MKIHDEIETWLAASVTDGLSASERETFERHLAECERCRALHHEEKTMSKAIGGMFNTVKPDDNFENRIAQKFRRRISARRNFRLGAWFLHFGQRPSVRWAAAILMLAALVKSGALLTGENFSMREPLQKEREILGRHRVITASGQFAGIEKDENKSRHEFFNMSDPGLLPGQNGTLSLGGENTYGGATTVSAGTLSADKNGPKSIEMQQRTILSDVSADRFYNAFAPNKESVKAKLGTTGFGIVDGLKPQGESEALAKTLGDLSGKIVEQRKIENGIADASRVELNYQVAQQMPGLAAATATPARPVEQPPASQLQSVDTTRKLIRNAALEFEVKSFDAAVETVRAITNEDAGYVATVDSARGANGKLRGTVAVKMLPANLDKFLLQLRALGELKNQKLGTDDVTKAYFDTDARLRNSKKMEERLLDMLQKNTGKVSDLLQVEKELNRVREDIERMQGELKYWDTLVAYATVTISLYEKDLNEPAAFLLKERANLSLFSPDVEKTYNDAKQVLNEAKAQVLQSKLERDANGRVTATLSVLFAPEIADQTIARMKALGRVDTFTTNDERVAQNGSGASDTARVERDKVEFNLVIAHDDESRRQTNITLVTPQVERSFDSIKSAAAEQHAEIVNSSLSRDPQGRSTGQITLRAPAKSYDALMDALKKFGRVASLAIQRNDRVGDDGSGPVLISLALTSEESPVQETNLNVLSDRVEQQSLWLKQAAIGLGAELKNSTFERQSGGVEVANLTFRLPMKNYAPFIEQIKQLGKVSNFTVRRSDSANADESAPAQIDVQIYSRGDVVPDENGVFATVRRTFAQAIGAVMWSARMIGVALAFISPWALAIAALVWIFRRMRHAK